MNPSEAEEKVKEVIEYASSEIQRNRKRNRVLVIVSLLVAAVLLIVCVDAYKKPAPVEPPEPAVIQGTSDGFDVAEFPAMDVRYAESGAPIVADPNAVVDHYTEGKGVILAKTVCDTWGCRDHDLQIRWFVIPEGMVFKVLSNDLSNGSVLIEYAGVEVQVFGGDLTLDV